MKMKFKSRRQSRKSFHRYPSCFFGCTAAAYVAQFCRLNHFVWEAA